MTDELSECLYTEALARVTWGDVPEDVAEYLVSRGMSAEEAGPLVKSLVEERNEEVRRRSLRKLLIGGALLIATVIFFAVLPWKDWHRALNDYLSWRGRRGGRTGLGDYLVMGAIASGVAGLWWTWRGFWGLVTPQAEELTDVE